MEYLAEKPFSFLQDCVFTSTNKWNILQKNRFLFCKIFHLLVLVNTQSCRKENSFSARYSIYWYMIYY